MVFSEYNLNETLLRHNECRFVQSVKLKILEFSMKHSKSLRRFIFYGHNCPRYCKQTGCSVLVRERVHKELRLPKG